MTRIPYMDLLLCAHVAVRDRIQPVDANAVIFITAFAIGVQQQLSEMLSRPLMQIWLSTKQTHCSRFIHTARITDHNPPARKCRNVLGTIPFPACSTQMIRGNMTQRLGYFLRPSWPSNICSIACRRSVSTTRRCCTTANIDWQSGSDAKS